MLRLEAVIFLSIIQVSRERREQEKLMARRSGEIVIQKKMSLFPKKKNTLSGRR